MTEIIRVEHANFDGTGETVSVTAIANDEECTFHVQTVCGRYRSCEGCWIFTDKCYGEIDFDDYPNFDFDEIISEANKFLEGKIRPTEYCVGIYGRAYIAENKLGFRVAFENENFFGDGQSGYVSEYNELETENGEILHFETYEKALAHARKLHKQIGENV